MISRRGLLGLAIVGGAAGVAGLSYRRLVNPPAGVDALSVTEAYRRANAGGILLVDIRRLDEWRQTGVPAGAMPLDMRRPDFFDMLAAARDQHDNPPVALICARGVRSRRLAQRLDLAGIQSILDVPEGMLGSFAGPGWIKTGLPTEPPPNS